MFIKINKNLHQNFVAIFSIISIILCNQSFAKTTGLSIGFISGSSNYEYDNQTFDKTNASLSGKNPKMSQMSGSLTDSNNIRGVKIGVSGDYRIFPIKQIGLLLGLDFEKYQNSRGDFNFKPSGWNYPVTTEDANKVKSTSPSSTIYDYNGNKPQGTNISTERTYNDQISIKDDHAIIGKIGLTIGNSGIVYFAIGKTFANASYTITDAGRKTAEVKPVNMASNASGLYTGLGGAINITDRIQIGIDIFNISYNDLKTDYMVWKQNMASTSISQQNDSQVGRGSYTELSFKNHGVKGYINLILL
jgi:hypothetical protein